MEAQHLATLARKEAIERQKVDKERERQRRREQEQVRKAEEEKRRREVRLPTSLNRRRGKEREGGSREGREVPESSHFPPFNHFPTA